MNETIEAAKAVDVIVLAIGEDCYCEVPGNIENLMISDTQQLLADELFKLNKKVIVVYLGGRPRIITNIASQADAVILGFLPGNRGAEAIADIMFGQYNPNARLPITYPRAPNGFVTYDRRAIEDFEFNHYDNLYPFGHGLSYTSFEYSDLELSPVQQVDNLTLMVSVKVRNSGSMEGKETVLLYMNDEVASISRPVQQLKGFKKVNLKPNEQAQVTFNLTLNDFSFINFDNKRVVEPGIFNFYVANLSTSFILNSVPTDPATWMSTSY